MEKNPQTDGPSAEALSRWENEGGALDKRSRAVAEEGLASGLAKIAPKHPRRRSQAVSLQSNKP